MAAYYITTPSGTENIHFLVEVFAFSHVFFGHSISDGDEQRTLTLKIYTNSQWTKMGFVTFENLASRKKTIHTQKEKNDSKYLIKYSSFLS